MVRSESALGTDVRVIAMIVSLVSAAYMLDGGCFLQAGEKLKIPLVMFGYTGTPYIGEAKVVMYGGKK